MVEDDLLLQQHLIEIIKVADDITCLGAVSSAEEAEQKIPSLQPDVVLMDINLPGKSGIDYIHKEVADQLGLTVPTVRTYVRRICFKLHVRSKVVAIIKYLS